MILRTLIVLGIGVLIGMNVGDRQGPTVDDAASKLPGAAQKQQYDELAGKASGYETQVRILEKCARQAADVLKEDDPGAAQKQLERSLKRCERKARKAAKAAKAAASQQKG